MKKYIATIAVTATAEVEVTLSPEEQEEYNNLTDEWEKNDYILDRATIKQEDMDMSDGLDVVFFEEI
jgi:hypothetical protein